ncbi:DoxX family membrane protein [Luteimonas gilva]|uniref:DoxX family membrane protein n=1 Tax=Luteimonas gilva TaxID=2572684 RepID=A0A4U5JVE7_9GAMM|nr:DoxX family membrane protein [Luteimonas gilva]TKR33892.1 DoxX family membrane protein [Luteimonas gilva]
MNRNADAQAMRTGPLGWMTERLSIGTGAIDGPRIGWGHALLAAVMIALGLRGLYYGDSASVWQPIPQDMPLRTLLVYACAAIELAAGIGLLVRRATDIAAAALFAFALLWWAALKLPVAFVRPLSPFSWLGVGEIGVIVAGAWTLFAMRAGDAALGKAGWLSGARGVCGARLLCALSLPMIGLSHFAYAKETAGFVPAWIPGPYFWAYLTGAASFCASLGMLSGTWPRLAIVLESAMLSVITVLVWLPGLMAAPSNDTWTPFLMSTAIACGAWAVADGYRSVPWRTMRPLRA